MAIPIPASKDPTDIRPFQINWPSKLVAGETITDQVIDVLGETDLIVSDVQASGASIKFTASGGRPKTYKLLCTIETSLGFRYQATALLKVENL